MWIGTVADNVGKLGTGSLNAGPGLFKLAKGNDCSTKSLPRPGKDVRKIPHNEKECITSEEALTVYDCLEAGQVVTPIHFCKQIVQTPSPRKLAYQKLDEILATEGSINPYEYMLLHPEEEKPPDPFLNVDFYNVEPKDLSVPNVHNMEEWSVLSTEMHYTDSPQGHPSLMVMDCKTTLLDEWDKSGKVFHGNECGTSRISHCKRVSGPI